MSSKNPFLILGVTAEATDEQIKRAYRQLSIKYHPDRNPGDETATTKFREITEAFQQINTEEKRREFKKNSTTINFRFGAQEVFSDYLANVLQCKKDN